MSKALGGIIVGALIAAATFAPTLGSAQTAPPPGTAAAPTAAQQAPSLPALPSLITQTPEEGWTLAVALSRRAVVSIQRDAPTRGRLRPEYADNASGVIAAAHVIALNFQTVAAANNYWRR
jgi:hypothetical protein